MSLITRGVKGSSLTIKEMDGNLTYLESNMILDVEYFYSSNSLIVKKPNDILEEIEIYTLDSKKIIGDKITIYDDIIYDDLIDPTNVFKIKYNSLGNKLSINSLYRKSCTLTTNLGYWSNNEYNTTTFTSSILSNELFDVTKSFIYPYKNTGMLPNNSGASQILTMLDGRILLIGDFEYYNGISVNYIVMLGSDGFVDTTFGEEVGIGSNFRLKLGDGVVPHSVVIQPDGKIILLGNLEIIRLNTDGTMDSTFNTGTGFDSFVDDIKLRADGTMFILSYYSTDYNGTPMNSIISLNADGTVDSTFDSVYYTDLIMSGFLIINSQGSGVKIEIQSDNKIILFGDILSSDGVPIIIRLNADGSIDDTFIPPTNIIVYSVQVQMDNKILISYYNEYGNELISRLNINGSIDDTWTQIRLFDGLPIIKLQPDGKILITNYSYPYNIKRLNIDGTDDTTFNTIEFNNNMCLLELQPDGKILIDSDYNSPTRIVYRFNSNGTSDSTIEEFNKVTSYAFRTNNNDTFILDFIDDELVFVSNVLIQKIVLSYRLIVTDIN